MARGMGGADRPGGRPAAGRGGGGLGARAAQDELPWDAWEGEDELCAELAGWLVRHAPARLRSQGAPEELLQHVRLLGLTDEARWEDPHWPGYAY
ncbi:hypothetical protein [Streptomyces endophytica]|uniref:hypothetical protein n=1 Tax=Streptomyces endophytica TaxID=2991496 RepID=UPI00311B3F39